MISFLGQDSYMFLVLLNHVFYDEKTLECIYPALLPTGV